MLNWGIKSMAVTMGSWKMLPPEFVWLVFVPRDCIHHLVIFLSHKKPEKPWNEQLTNINSRSVTRKNLHLLLFAWANVALTFVASCACYHASCAVPSADAINDVQKKLSNFVWSGDPGKREYCFVTDSAASASRHQRCLALPNNQAICDVHLL